MSAFAPDEPGADVRASPNFGPPPRRAAAGDHHPALHRHETGPAAEDWLCNPASEVSSHYLVHEDGRVVQMVRERDRAWHAGKSCWHGVTDINSQSIGIEIVNPGHQLGYRPFPRRQIGVRHRLCRGIAGRHAIRPEMVLGHSDVAPGRKVDPGEKFPWAELRARALAISSRLRGIAADRRFVRAITASASSGYRKCLPPMATASRPAAIMTKRPPRVVAAFQRHFRPKAVDGVADRATRETLKRLLAAVPAQAPR